MLCEACGKEIQPGETFAIIKYQTAYSVKIKAYSGQEYFVTAKKKTKGREDDYFHLKCGIAQRYTE